MKKRVLIGIVSVIIIGLAASAVYFTPVKNQLSSVFQSSTNTQETETKEKPPCATPRECSAQQATNVAQAVAAIQAHTNDPKIVLSVQENTIKEQVTVFCTKDKKCWGYDNKTKEVTER